MDVNSYLAEAACVPYGQVVFFWTLILSVPIAILFRTKLSPQNTSCATRHLVGAGVGFVFLIWSFGWAVSYLILQTIGVYIIMVCLPSHINYKIAFAYAMGYLLYIQVKRLLEVNDRDVMEISYPMMMSTQKLTSLAFSIHDGVQQQKESLKGYRKKYAWSRNPSLLEVFGYIFYFGGVITGPTYFFKDYMDFISGDNYKNKENEKETTSGQNGTDSANGNQNSATSKIEITIPDPTREVVKKLMISVGSLLVHLFIYVHYSVEKNGDWEFITSHSFFYRVLYIGPSHVLCAFRFFFAWQFAEAVQNASGFGLHYVDGEPQWDLIKSVNFKGFCFPNYLRDMARSWNISTGRWLRHVGFERTGKFGLVATYALSAVWHGIEPGYYFAFLSAPLATVGSDKLEKMVGSVVNLGDRWTPLVSVFKTFWVHTAAACVMIPCHVLHWQESVNFHVYSMYFWIHILSVIALVIPFKTKSRKEKEKSS